MEQNTPPIVTVLFEDLSNDEAYDIEKKLIEQYGRKFVGERTEGQLYNISEYRGGYPTGKSVTWSADRYDAHVSRMKSKRLFDPSYEELYNEFVTLNKTRKQISIENKVSEVLVKKRLK
jgi:hypothetical protein